MSLAIWRDLVVSVTLAAVLWTAPSPAGAQGPCGPGSCQTKCVCNISTSFWQDRKNFDVYCAKPLTDRILTCVWLTDEAPDCGDCEGCAYNVTDVGLTLGLQTPREVLGAAPCQVKLSGSRQGLPCLVVDDRSDTTTTLSSPAPTPGHRTSGGQQLRHGGAFLVTSREDTGVQAPAERASVWTPLSAGMTSAVGGLVVVLGVVVALWRRDRLRLKAKYIYPTVATNENKPLQAV